MLVKGSSKASTAWRKEGQRSTTLPWSADMCLGHGWEEATERKRCLARTNSLAPRQVQIPAKLADPTQAVVLVSFLLRFRCHLRFLVDCRTGSMDRQIAASTVAGCTVASSLRNACVAISISTMERKCYGTGGGRRRTSRANSSGSTV